MKLLHDVFIHLSVRLLHLVFQVDVVLQKVLDDLEKLLVSCL